MNKEQLFSNAVSLAAAFIANGDIRLSGSTDPDSNAVTMTSELISTLYRELASLDRELSPPPVSL